MPWPPDQDEPGDDNVIMMPGLGRIPEPSPIRHGGPERPPRPGLEGRPDRREDDTQAEGGPVGPELVEDLDPDSDLDHHEGDLHDLHDLVDGGGEEVELDRVGAAAHPPAWLMVPALEALLFAADGPLNEGQLDEFLGSPGLQAVRGAIAALGVRYSDGSGIRLVQVAKGWQFRTDPRFSRWVSAMRGGRPVRLSKAALETLAMVAYRQPVTKSEIDELRGVDCGGVLRMLVDRGLVAVNGRRDEPGRPLLYGSTREFLSLFGLRDLSDLPTLRDLRELQDDDPSLGPLGEEALGQQPLALQPSRPTTLDPTDGEPATD